MKNLQKRRKKWCVGPEKVVRKPCLAWSLKAWAALLVPETPRHAREHRIQKRTLLRMEFKTFRAAMIEIPCQIVRSGRRLVYRCCPGIRGRVSSCGWWSGSMAAGCTESRQLEAGVWMPRSV